MKKYLVAILGPTAVGKTATSIQIAQHFCTDILSCDSRQFFREMKIGTASPSREELGMVPHHFVGNKSVLDKYNVGMYEKEARECLKKIHSKKNIAVMVGGSGLYANAVIQGLDDFPDIDNSIRESLNEKLEKRGITTLLNQLKELDPGYYHTVDKNNPQRIIRALEVCISTKRKYSSFRKNTSKFRPFETIKIGIHLAREKLYRMISQRVDLMMEMGLLSEVKKLAPYRCLNSLQTVGYKELFAYLDGEFSLNFAVEEIKKNTRRYAKRQLTWFRKDTHIKWFEPQQIPQIINHIEKNYLKV